MRQPVPDQRTEAGPIVACRSVVLHYDDRSALSNITIDLHAGEILSLLGPNGAGKSTLLKVIAGMLRPSHGEVTYRGSRVLRPHPAITYVPQRSDADWTFPISVRDVVLLGLARNRSRLRGFTADDKQRAGDALRAVRMDHLMDAQIGALSGGQQQRVFLARALVSHGEVLLLDEPFTGVDVPTQEMLVEIFGVLRAQGTAVVYATHDLQQAARTADRVLMLNREVIAIGSPEEVMTEETLRRAFGGQVLIFHGATGKDHSS